MKKTVNTTKPRGVGIPQDVRIGLARHKRILHESRKALRAYLRAGTAMHRLEKAFLDANIEV